jgi:hypothetical protein
MEFSEIINGILRCIGPLMAIFIFANCRGVPRHGRRSRADARPRETIDLQEIARNWNAPRRGARRDSPAISISTRSDPMWDRELDG